MSPDKQGTLYLVPAPLDFGGAPQPLGDSMPDHTMVVAASITHWICENAKSARAYLKRIGETHPLAATLQEQQITELPREIHKKGDHDGSFDAKPMLLAARAGHNIGLLSEAGMPAIADPGASVVRAAHDMSLQVVPLVGPVSLLLALAASGLNGQNFAFVGYLPQDPAQRVLRIRELEALAIEGQTQIFIETPYRNAAIWDALVKTLQPKTRLAIASALTLPNALARCKTTKAWRGETCPAPNDVPAVYLIGK